MPPVGFEPTISADERPKTFALDSTATGIGITGIALIEKENKSSEKPLSHCHFAHRKSYMGCIAKMKMRSGYFCTLSYFRFLNTDVRELTF